MFVVYLLSTSLVLCFIDLGKLEFKRLLNYVTLVTLVLTQLISNWYFSTLFSVISLLVN